MGNGSDLPACSASTGRLVVRYLPQGVESDFDQTRKPKASIDASVLVEGAGALHYCPVVPRLNESFQPTLPLKPLPTACSVRLDAFIFSTNPKNCATLNETPKADLTATLTRNGDENIEKCLNRLAISLAKKLRPKTPKKQKVQDSSSKCVPVWDDGNGKLEECDTSKISTAEFWRTAAYRPLTIECSFQTSTVSLHVECNPPTILSVSTYEKFTADIFPGVPILVSVETLFASDFVVDWYANEDRVCHNSPLYIPKESDAGKFLSILITPTRPGHDGEGCEEAYHFKEPVSMQRPSNTLLDIRKEWVKPRQRTKTCLRVMSFNILAEQNAFSGPNRTSFFPWVSGDVLKRSRRLPLVLHEIISYQADIICLQEVDQLVFDTLLQPVLQYYNYQGYYSVKQTLGNQEGCAAFWSLDKFQEVSPCDIKTFSLGELVGNYARDPQEDDYDWEQVFHQIKQLFQLRPDLLDIIQTKLGHVVQIVSLKDHEGNPLVVANTHLFFHPKATHIRILQLVAIAHQLVKAQGPQEKPFMLFGDLNTSLKYCGELLFNRHVPKNYQNLQECLNHFQWEDTDIPPQFDDDFPEIRLPDSFPSLASAYPDEPLFTHYIAGFCGTLDHIMMTTKTKLGELHFRKQAEMPTVEQVTKDVAMPSASFPSDHVALVSDLVWLPAK